VNELILAMEFGFEQKQKGVSSEKARKNFLSKIRDEYKDNPEEISKMNKFLFKDNIKRLFLYDMLRRKSYLGSLTLNQLENLVIEINILTSNLQSDLKDGIPMIKISDEDNWPTSSLLRDIFLHNVLDVKIKNGGSTKDFKEKLEKIWSKKKDVADKI